MDKIKLLLKEMGLTEEQVTKFVTECITDKFIPKHRFDEINQKNSQLEQTVSERDKQIKELSKFEGDNATLKEQIEKLQEENKQKDEQNQKAITELKMQNAISQALSGKVQQGYNDIVENLIDKSLITIKSDGTISGLEEQIIKLQQDKPLLFEENKPEGNDKKPNGWNFKGSNPQDGKDASKKSVSENFVQSLLDDNSKISETTKQANDYYFGQK